MARQFKVTELGVEIQCSKCRDFYPADTEFFYKQSRDKWGLHSWCKACYVEQPSAIARRKRYAEKVAKRKPKEEAQNAHR
ncbi:hypothetical protein RO21_06115 [[Actinobacillus] muris]|uniref:Uncharacterized protein n=1 Tax=Muribacter muris TaxID=67855 RepID=A0A0J5S3W4_9PAST|nr:hypothetical protein [Muribacter muris]KMK51487.1 hypothetical protein RO21_06115 [[Actinobacillus] muris] [Muribacter muris]